jgi:hypothetical protein
MEVAGWTRLVLGNMWRPFRGKAATTVLKRTIYEHPVNYNNTFPSDRSFGRWVIRKQIHLYLPRPGDFLHRGLQKDEAACRRSATLSIHVFLSEARP